ncbi:hypothetical protein P4J23_10915 [Bacillus cereus]|nr:hypothetical protein [Bacillus cereus]
MSLLSHDSEKEIESIISKAVDRVLEARERQQPINDIINQKTLMQELNISYTFIKKMEAHGLKRLQFDSESRTVFYSRKQLYSLFDRLAQ